MSSTCCLSKNISFKLSTLLNRLTLCCGLIALSSVAVEIPSSPSLEKSTLTQKTPIKVVTEYYPPYSFKDRNGTLKGCAVELVRALFKLNKDELKITLMPWSRAYITAVNFKNTLIFSISRNNIRESKFHWIGKIKQEKYFFWGLREKYSTAKISDQEFKSSLIVVAKYTTNDQMLSAKGENKLYRVTELTQGINMLLAHRVDLIVETQVGLKKRFEKQGYDFNKIVPVYKLPELDYDLYIAMNINSDPQIVENYYRAYQQLVDNGTVEKIINQCAK